MLSLFTSIREIVRDEPFDRYLEWGRIEAVVAAESFCQLHKLAFGDYSFDGEDL